MASKGLSGYKPLTPAEERSAKTTEVKHELYRLARKVLNNGLRRDIAILAKKSGLTSEAFAELLGECFFSAKKVGRWRRQLAANAFDGCNPMGFRLGSVTRAIKYEKEEAILTARVRPTVLHCC